MRACHRVGSASAKPFQWSKLPDSGSLNDTSPALAARGSAGRVHFRVPLALWSQFHLLTRIPQTTRTRLERKNVSLRLTKGEWPGFHLPLPLSATLPSFFLLTPQTAPSRPPTTSSSRPSAATSIVFSSLIRCVQLLRQLQAASPVSRHVKPRNASSFEGAMLMRLGTLKRQARKINELATDTSQIPSLCPKHKPPTCLEFVSVTLETMCNFAKILSALDHHASYPSLTNLASSRCPRQPRRQAEGRLQEEVEEAEGVHPRVQAH